MPRRRNGSVLPGTPPGNCPGLTVSSWLSRKPSYLVPSKRDTLSVHSWASGLWSVRPAQPRPSPGPGVMLAVQAPQGRRGGCGRGEPPFPNPPARLISSSMPSTPHRRHIRGLGTWCLASNSPLFPLPTKERVLRQCTFHGGSQRFCLLKEFIMSFP